MHPREVERVSNISNSAVKVWLLPKARQRFCVGCVYPVAHRLLALFHGAVGDGDRAWSVRLYSHSHPHPCDYDSRELFHPTASQN